MFFLIVEILCYFCVWNETASPVNMWFNTVQLPLSGKCISKLLFVNNCRRNLGARKLSHQFPMQTMIIVSFFLFFNIITISLFGFLKCGKFLILSTVELLTIVVVTCCESHQNSCTKKSLDAQRYSTGPLPYALLKIKWHLFTTVLKWNATELTKAYRVFSDAGQLSEFSLI